MVDYWLEKKLSEIEDKETKFTFKFQGAINWMRALAILCELSQFKEELKEKYKAPRGRTPIFVG